MKRRRGEKAKRKAPDVLTSRKTWTKEDFREKAFKDHELFCRELFPTIFYMPFSKWHYKLFELIFSSHPYVGVMAPRKFGKTPIICFSFPIKQIVYNLETYIVIVSETVSEASRHVMKIVKTFETNERIHHYFGNFVHRKAMETTKDSVQFLNGIWLRAKGLGSQIRGTAGDTTPPSLIIVDDPQSDKDVKTQTSLQNAADWFEDEIIYSKAQKWLHPRFGKIAHGRVRFLGTSIHPDCLAERVMRDSRFLTLRLAMMQDEEGRPDHVNGRSIWEAMFPTEQLVNEWKAAEKNGVLSNWLQERQNIPRQRSSQVFNVDDIRYWDVGDNRFDVLGDMPVFVMEEDLGIFDDRFVLMAEEEGEADDRLGHEVDAEVHAVEQGG